MLLHEYLRLPLSLAHALTLDLCGNLPYTHGVSVSQATHNSQITSFKAELLYCHVSSQEPLIASNYFLMKAKVMETSGLLEGAIT